MRDLTQGSIPKHLISLAVPIGVGMLFQMLYVLIDLYFVSRLGDAAIAGVGAAGNLQFLVMAMSQVLAVGGMALIAQACGRKDAADANRVFNQSLLLALLAAVATLIAGYAFSGAYMRLIAADAASAAAGVAYLHAFLPGLALQFALATLGAALRGTGISKPTMLVQIVTVLLNALLAPVLIAGWLTGRAFGVAGAGWASSISIAAGVALMLLYFARLEHFVGVDARELRPQPPVWRRILSIGLPPGGEFALMFVFMGVTYWCLRGLGTDAQAGYGIGMRVMQAIFLPVMAIAFAVAPVAGQNVGAGRGERVLATFHSAALIGSAAMFALTLLCQWQPQWFMRPFADNAQAAEVAVGFLRIVSWNFVASGLIFTCSGMFQALGNTRPSLYASASRLLTFAVPAVWLSQHPGFELHRLWLLSVATTVLQALTVLWLLRRELKLRLPGLAAG
ncbi:MATE family efflux transporter [Lysobacter enzymogenes]|uniref:MATE family efflux transporter n=1 Tax=Lysobacter enzymogenes TaxID=69 RepID=UPI001A95A22A|nr:MATE family efflux transporter [Lysobacter enzymogenes]QQP96891.1 MATE family efflux transporter [Lysobacter enzymogenes]